MSSKDKFGILGIIFPVAMFTCLLTTNAVAGGGSSILLKATSNSPVQFDSIIGFSQAETRAVNLQGPRGATEGRPSCGTFLLTKNIGSLSPVFLANFFGGSPIKQVGLYFNDNVGDAVFRVDLLNVLTSSIGATSSADGTLTQQISLLAEQFVYTVPINN